MNQKSRNQGNNKKFVCLFDSSHIVESEEKLASHMRKCKAMEKDSFLCCKYNALHWVKHNLIDSHEESCPDKNKAQEKVDDFSRWLPNEISQFSIPFEIDMSMVSSSVLNEKKNPKIEPPKQENIGMKKKTKDIIEKPKKIEMWREPCFEDYLKKKGYKEKSLIISTNQNESFMGNNQSFLF